MSELKFTVDKRTSIEMQLLDLSKKFGDIEKEIIDLQMEEADFRFDKDNRDYYNHILQLLEIETKKRDEIEEKMTRTELELYSKKELIELLAKEDDFLSKIFKQLNRKELTDKIIKEKAKNFSIFF